MHGEGKAGGMHAAHSRDGTSFSVTSTEQKALLKFFSAFLWEPEILRLALKAVILLCGKDTSLSAPGVC